MEFSYLHNLWTAKLVLGVSKRLCRMNWGLNQTITDSVVKGCMTIWQRTFFVHRLHGTTAQIRKSFPKLITRQVWLSWSFQVRERHLNWYLQPEGVNPYLSEHSQVYYTFPSGGWGNYLLCKIIQRNLRGRRIVIYSGFQAAIKNISAYQIISRVMWICMQSLTEVYSSNKLTLRWDRRVCGLCGQ